MRCECINCINNEDGYCTERHIIIDFNGVCDSLVEKEQTDLDWEIK